jgi:hypothetical protein
MITMGQQSLLVNVPGAKVKTSAWPIALNRMIIWVRYVIFGMHWVFAILFHRNVFFTFTNCAIYINRESVDEMGIQPINAELKNMRKSSEYIQSRLTRIHKLAIGWI